MSKKVLKKELQEKLITEKKILNEISYEILCWRKTNSEFTDFNKNPVKFHLMLNSASCFYKLYDFPLLSCSNKRNQIRIYNRSKGRLKSQKIYSNSIKNSFSKPIIINRDLQKYKLNSPFSDKIFNVFFEKNIYISDEKDLWKIVAIINDEIAFERILTFYQNTINKNFIEALFKTSTDLFYIDKDSKKIYTNTQLNFHEKISLLQLLKYLNVNEIENLIEKSVISI